jgi:tellurite resistance protein
MKLDTPLVQRLRNHLIQQSRHSIGPLHGGSAAQLGSEEEAAVLNRFRPFGELLYLVAHADGRIDPEEQALMMGAFRVLTSGRVRGALLAQLEDELSSSLKEEGVEARLEVVCNALSKDREDAELALSLASAVALADCRIDANEAQLISQLASWLGISKNRANELLAIGHQSIPPRARA